MAAGEGEGVDGVHGEAGAVDCGGGRGGLVWIYWGQKGGWERGGSRRGEGGLPRVPIVPLPASLDGDGVVSKLDMGRGMWCEVQLLNVNYPIFLSFDFFRHLVLQIPQRVHVCLPLSASERGVVEAKACAGDG